MKNSQRITIFTNIVKNKIHCSCPDCRDRSTGHGDNSIEQLKISEQKKIQSMESQLENEDI